MAIFYIFFVCLPEGTMGFPHDETSLGDDKHHDSRNE